MFGAVNADQDGCRCMSLKLAPNGHQVSQSDFRFQGYSGHGEFEYPLVAAGLVPAIHLLLLWLNKTWMPGRP